MNAYLGLLQQALVFGFITVTLVAGCVALACPWIAGQLRRLAPAAQSRLLWALCALPVLATLTLLAAALLPSLLELAGLSTDHCEGHELGHLHFCVVHLPPVVASTALLLLPAGAMLVLAAAMFAQVVKDVRAVTKLRHTLLACPVARRLDTATVLESALPLAFTCGFLRPRVFLSSGLLANLTEPELAMILAHENSHASRLDGFRLLTARALSVLHLPGIRRALLEDLQLACEQASDAAAAPTAGSATRMAALLLKVERLYQLHLPSATPLVPGVLGSAPSSLPARIEALLEPTVRQPSGLFLPACIVFAVLLFGAHDGVHDAFEHLLYFLAGTVQ